MKIFNIQQPALGIKNALVDKINNLTKPKGSLGTLEELALQIGLIQQTLSPQLCHPQNIIFCADHGIADEGKDLLGDAVNTFGIPAHAGVGLFQLVQELLVFGQLVIKPHGMLADQPGEIVIQPLLVLAQLVDGKLADDGQQAFAEGSSQIVEVHGEVLLVYVEHSSYQ